jgi:hypothetical protein
VARDAESLGVGEFRDRDKSDDEPTADYGADRNMGRWTPYNSPEIN